MRKTKKVTRKEYEYEYYCDKCHKKIGFGHTICVICERDLCLSHTSICSEFDSDYPNRMCEDCMGMDSYKEINGKRTEMENMIGKMEEKWKREAKKLFPKTKWVKK